MPSKETAEKFFRDNPMRQLFSEDHPSAWFAMHIFRVISKTPPMKQYETMEMQRDLSHHPGYKARFMPVLAILRDSGAVCFNETLRRWEITDEWQKFYEDFLDHQHILVARRDLVLDDHFDAVPEELKKLVGLHNSAIDLVVQRVRFVIPVCRASVGYLNNDTANSTLVVRLSWWPLESKVAHGQLHEVDKMLPDYNTTEGILHSRQLVSRTDELIHRCIRHPKNVTGENPVFEDGELFTAQDTQDVF